MKEGLLKTVPETNTSLNKTEVKMGDGKCVKFSKGAIHRKQKSHTCTSSSNTKSRVPSSQQ